jgi:hypothetical protein
MKKLIHSVDSAVIDALKGAAAAPPCVTSLQMRGFPVACCALTPQLSRPRYATVDTPALRWGP